MNNFAKGFARGFATVLSLPVFALVGLNGPALTVATINHSDFQFTTGLPTSTTTEGNFNPDAALDTTQVLAGHTISEEDLTMFCFDSETEESGWDCFQLDDIPTTAYYQNDDHLVWAGPAKKIESAYDRLN